MTLDEAIAHARKVAENVRYNAYTFTEQDLLKEECRQAKAECLECVAEHEQLAEWLTELQKRREADVWIPVTERLPDEDGQYEVTREEYIPSGPEYRVFDDDGAPHWEMVVDLARFEGNYNRANGLENFNNGFNKAYRVYAWRPLPEPYKEREDKT